MNQKNKLQPRLRFTGFTKDWNQKKVKELCSTSTGKGNTQDKVENGKYPFYVRSPKIERSNEYLYDQEAVLTVGDGVGTGKVFHYVNGKYNLHQRVYRMYNFNELIFGKFFYYYFSKFFYKRVLSMSAKTSVDSVRMDMITEMEIHFPEMDEQKMISNFLSNVDCQIKQEQLKLNYFRKLKSGYLQKLFPNDHNNIPQLRFKGFTDDWEQVKLSDLTKFHKQGFYTTESYDETKKYYLLRGTDLTGNKLAINNDTPKINASEKEFNDFKVEVGDVLLVRSGGVGTYGIVYDEVQGIFGSYLIDFRFDQTQMLNEFFGYFYESDLFKQQLRRISQQSANLNINAENIKSISINLPSNEEQKKIKSILKQIDNLITLQQRKLDALKRLKKGYLQKLFC